MNISIRSYCDEDLQACRQLWGELTERHRRLYGDDTIGGENPDVHFDRYLEMPNLAGIWVAEKDSMVVGFSGLLTSEWDAEIEPVVVTEAQRSQGIGRLLIQKLVEEARRLNVRFLSLRPVARNKEAIELFVSLGFNIVGQVELFQELSSPQDRQWEDGFCLHGKRLRY
jgi:GNAT superfamily N-acetyltransferase